MAGHEYTEATGAYLLPTGRNVSFTQVSLPHLPGCQVVHGKFPCCIQEQPNSIGRLSIARERNQTCFSVLRPHGMEGSVPRLQPSPAVSKKVGAPPAESYAIIHEENVDLQSPILQLH